MKQNDEVKQQACDTASMKMKLLKVQLKEVTSMQTELDLTQIQL